MKISKKIEKGQKAYSKVMLNLYDFLVIKISNNYIWKCPTKKLQEHYNNNVTNNHLDIGVGTGYFLNNCKFPNYNLRLAIMDLNKNSLETTEKKIKRYNPEKYRVNILEKITQKIKPFDSISMNHIIHCLPGNMDEKSIIFDNIKEILSKDGILFGATLLQPNESKYPLAKRLMNFYNKKEIFNNSKDNINDLERNISQKFSKYKIKEIGCAGLFWAQK